MSDQAGVSNSNWFINIAGAIIAVMVVGLLWFIAYALVFLAIPDANQTTLAQVIGVVSTQVGMVVGWYYGSSSASKRQGEIIAQQAVTQDKLASTAAAIAGTTTTTTTGQAAPAVHSQPDQPAIKPLVRPIEVTQEEWDAMNDAEKGAAVLKYSKP